MRDYELWKIARSGRGGEYTDLALQVVDEILLERDPNWVRRILEGTDPEAGVAIMPPPPSFPMTEIGRALRVTLTALAVVVMPPAFVWLFAWSFSDVGLWYKPIGTALVLGLGSASRYVWVAYHPPGEIEMPKPGSGGALDPKHWDF